MDIKGASIRLSLLDEYSKRFQGKSGSTFPKKQLYEKTGEIAEIEKLEDPMEIEKAVKNVIDTIKT